MNIDFTGKTVLITGSAGEIGLAAAKLFLENGANVVIHDVDTAKGEKVLGELLQSYTNVVFIPGDISSKEDDERLVNQTVETFGSLDILVNNAGINGQQPERKPFHAYSLALWDKIIGIDLNGTFYLSYYAANQMIRQGRGGKIVNIASVMGVTPARLQCAFTAAKAGVIMLTRVMALELAPYGINVNCVSPGSILTEKTYDKFYSDKEKCESLLSHIPMKKPGETVDIANAILYMASQEAKYVNGDNMIVDGGWMCGYTRDW
jgi:NAD(P)-dependent dehydrogenase (short-subunit alcohol dehydrogenase family)